MAPQTSTEAGNALRQERNWVGEQKKNHSPRAVVARLGIRNFGLTRRV